MEAHQILFTLIWGGGLGLTLLLEIYYWLPPGGRRLLETLAVALISAVLGVGSLALACWAGLPAVPGALVALGVWRVAVSGYCLVRRRAPLWLAGAGALWLPAWLGVIYFLDVFWPASAAIAAVVGLASFVLARKLKPYGPAPGW